MTSWTTYIANALVPGPPDPPVAELKVGEDKTLSPTSAFLSIPKFSLSQNSSLHNGSREEINPVNIRVFSPVQPTQSSWSFRRMAGKMQSWVDVSRPLTTSIYTRSLLTCGFGYPLWPCATQNTLPSRVLSEGIVIGDVGILRDGTFEFLFNICKSRVDDSSDAKYQVQLGHPLFRGHWTETDDIVERGRVIMSCTYQISQEGSDYVYHSREKHGGLLHLPARVERRSIDDDKQVKDFAIQHATEWYRLACRMNGAMINGSLFLVTGHDKTSFASAAYHSLPPGGKIRLQLSKPESVGSTNELQASYPLSDDGRFGVQTSCVGSTTGKEEKPNRCIFIRGFKIKLGEKDSEVSLTQIKPKQTLTPAEIKDIFAAPSLVPVRARGAS